MRFSESFIFLEKIHILKETRNKIDAISRLDLVQI